MESLASKVKSLALVSRPQVLENWPVLGSRTTLFFELLKLCKVPEKKFWKTFFTGEHVKKLFVDFFLENTCACVLGPWPWSQAFLSFALRESVLGRAVLGLGLEPCVLDSTSDYEIKGLKTIPLKLRQRQF